jgi:hypothetical protein
MRLVPATDRFTVDHFAVLGRARLHIHHNQFVRPVANTFGAQCPNVDELLLSFDSSEIR